MSGSTFKVEEFNDVCKTAEENGLEVVTGDDRTLLLDLDSGVKVDDAILKDLFSVHPVQSQEYWASKSGKGLHARVIFKEGISLTPTERALLQVCLGSDPRRDLFALIQIRNGFDPHVLFRPKKG